MHDYKLLGFPIFVVNKLILIYMQMLLLQDRMVSLLDLFLECCVW